MYDSTPDTVKHIATIRGLIDKVIVELLRRSMEHDLSKLREPEKSVFDIMTPRLQALTYDSEEYKASLRELGVALEHHYLMNDHHPEHYPVGVADPRLESIIATELNTVIRDCLQQTIDSQRSRIRGMNLVSVLEMLCDWKAACERHDGDIMTSIEKSQKRFGFSDELKCLLINTLELLK